MRAVRAPEELEHAFATAQAEAEANFKDGRLYMEKLIEQSAPRRSASARRCLRQRRARRRARLFGAEAVASKARSKRRRRPSSPSGRAHDLHDIAVARRASGAYTERGHARISRQRRRRVFHGDEHAHPGRASGDRNGVRRRSRRASRFASPRASSSRYEQKRSRRARPRDRVPHQRRRCREQFRARGGHAHRTSACRAAAASASIRTCTPGSPCRRFTIRCSQKSSRTRRPATRRIARMDGALRETAIAGVSTTIGDVPRNHRRTDAFRARRRRDRFLAGAARRRLRRRCCSA